MNVDPRVQKGGAAPADVGHNSAALDEKRATMYHNKKDRVFVRGIQGEYNLKEELDRLRTCRACARRRRSSFIDGPQCFSRHYVEPKDGITQTFHMHLEEYAPGRRVAEARPRQRGRLLHPRRRGLRDPRRRALRLEGGRRRHRAQQLRAPALQRLDRQARPRARHQDQADVPVHEHAVPEDRAGAPRRR